MEPDLAQMWYERIMRSFSRPIMVSGLLIATAVSFAQTLGPGSKAPNLDIKTWFKGSPVKSFEKGKVYVVEVWATWCGPCIASMPHISELARNNKDEIGRAHV